VHSIDSSSPPTSHLWPPRPPRRGDRQSRDPRCSTPAATTARPCP